MTKLLFMVLVTLMLAGCKTGRPSHSQTNGDVFHGGGERIFAEERGNVTVIWRAERKAE